MVGDDAYHVLRIRSETRDSFEQRLGPWPDHARRPAEVILFHRITSPQLERHIDEDRCRAAYRIERPGRAGRHPNDKLETGVRAPGRAGRSDPFLNCLKWSNSASVTTCRCRRVDVDDQLPEVIDLGFDMGRD